MAEIHPLIGDIIEYRLVAVALILHIADFHVELQARSYLARTYHRVVLAGFRLFIPLKIRRFGFAEHPLTLRIRFYVGFAHLQTHERTGQRNHTDIMPGGSLNSHHVAYLKRDISGIEIKTFAGVFKLHLNHVIVGITSGDILKIVEAMQLHTHRAVAAYPIRSCTFTAAASAFRGLAVAVGRCTAPFPAIVGALPAPLS